VSPADGVDWYDIQAMIRDARSEIRGEIDNAVHEATRQLRSEHDDYVETVDAALGRLQTDVRELREDVAAALASGGTLA
jgi:F0F1-type ATP synthase membrane subunit b/b'